MISANDGFFQDPFFGGAAAESPLGACFGCRVGAVWQRYRYVVPR